VRRADSPLVSVVLAVRNDARFVRIAVDSVLRQTLSDLELIVIDDASTDETPRLLTAVSDPRLVVLTNDDQAGLAASLNRGLDRASGRYVARLDADDVALPDRLALQVARLRREPEAAIAGTAILEVDENDVFGRLHRMPLDARPVRWLSLFTSPLVHPTILVDREVLDRHGFRYDSWYLESEDYDLLTRLLGVAEGANLPQPLVLYRQHPGQASKRRSDLQRSFQRDVALREIASVAPDLAPDDAELAWGLGSGRGVPEGLRERAAEVYAELLERFDLRHGTDAGVREAAARTLARAGFVRRSFALAPWLPLRVARERGRRTSETQAARRRALAWLAELGAPSKPLQITFVSPEPTPYRAPVFDRLARRSDLDLTVIYVARTLMGRTWSVEPHHRALFLQGVRVPGARRLLHHEFPVTPGIFRRLAAAKPDAVVVVGWSTFASLATISWCRLRGVPYVLEVDSHDEGPRAGWRRAVKGTVVPRIVRGAAAVLVTGTLVRRSMIARGADPDRIRLFAVTVDAAGFRRRAQELASRRAELRRELGLGPDDVAVLSAGRLAPEKGLDTLIRAVAAARVPELAVVIAGSGPEHARLEQLAASLGVRLVLLGDTPWERMVERYVAADVFALLSAREPWGVVVNEAAACGLPLVLSDRVGAAFDLLRDGENGVLVLAGDVESAASGLRRLAQDPAARAAAGARSQELMEGWGYEPSIEGFLGAVRAAVSR